MADLDDPRILAFLSAGTRTGKLGFTARDGRPLVAPIWFLVEGSGEDTAIVFNTGTGTAKGRAEEFGRRNGVPGELVVRLHPSKVIAELDMTS